MSVESIIRAIQGERPGMHAVMLPNDEQHVLELLTALYPDRMLWPGITIEQEVRLTDVSFWQGEIDFIKMKQAGIAGALIRAGQRNWVDTRFKVNWNAAKAAGLPRGSYWFYDSREDPVKQANLWWSLLEGDHGELVLLVDLEENYGGPYGTKEHFKSFIRRILELSGLPDYRIVIYTGFYWWMERVGNDSFFKRFDVHIAWYAQMSVVKVPLPWEETDLVFWQYTSSGPGALYGVSSAEIDLNWFCCNRFTFINRFGLAHPGEEEGTMEIYEIMSNTSASRSIRSAPDVRSMKVGDLLAGKVARSRISAETVHIFAADVLDPSMPTGYAARAGDVWRKVYENDGQPVNGWIAEKHLGQTLIVKTQKTVPDVDPEPSDPDLPVTIVLGDGIEWEQQTITTIVKRKQ